MEQEQTKQNKTKKCRCANNDTKKETMESRVAIKKQENENRKHGRIVPLFDEHEQQKPTQRQMTFNKQNQLHFCSFYPPSLPPTHYSFFFFFHFVLIHCVKLFSVKFILVPALLLYNLWPLLYFGLKLMLKQNYLRARLTIRQLHSF